MKFIGIDIQKLNIDVNDDLKKIMSNVGKLETNNKFLKNSKGSSAVGKYQIINRTFRSVVNLYSECINPIYFKSHTVENDDSIMLLIMDYYLSKLKLSAIDTGTTYLCHFLGAERANKLLTNESLKVIDVMTANEIKWNKDVFKRFKLSEEVTGLNFIASINNLF